MTKKTLTVFEDRYSRKQLTDVQKKELLSLESLWGKQNLILRADDRLLLRKYVGFIATPSLQIQILPKLFEDSVSAEDAEKEKLLSVRMLFRLLSSSGFLSIKDIPNPQQIAVMNGDLLEIFISIFTKKFLDLFHKQIHRQYEEREQNMVTIKGRILFQQQLLRNGFFKHKHYVNYQEFTENNLLNQIFKTTINSLRVLTKSDENKKNLNMAIMLLENIQFVRLSESLFSQVRFNRLNESYRALFQLAKMFYHNRQPGIHSGDERTFTFLVPLNQLFEYTLYQWIHEGLSPEGLEVKYQKPQRFLDSQNDVFLLKPDITIQSESNVHMIVDAKYKNPVSDSKVDLSESDVYQMLAYAVRYQCDRLCLVYPMFLNNKALKNPLATYVIQNGSQSIHISAFHIDISQEDLISAKSELVHALSEGIVLIEK
ncbi:McrC family protein [Paenibacillus sp. NPDC058071]|uniref:McrC family protein n=1 Tax=Paenibacillus sp. NPDC058071 TaxID=3346326 RepID=UPI0036D91AEB